MKNIIERNYGVKVEDLVECDEYCYFMNDGECYYFVLVGLDEVELNNWLQMLGPAIYMRNTHEIMRNSEGKIDTEGRVLLRIKGMSKGEFGVDDIIKFNNYVSVDGANKQMSVVKWSLLWEKKIDYLEYQVSELGKDKSVVLRSFSYYLGLAETACAYVNKVFDTVKRSDSDRYVISHKRIYYPNVKLNFYNPLLYIVDLEIRDICEYLKSKFWEDEDVWGDIDRYFNNVELGEYSYHMFYARMIYPSYYFDCYERVMSGSSDEEVLVKYVARVDEYEDFLRGLKKYLSRYVNLFNVEWLS